MGFSFPLDVDNGIGVATASSLKLDPLADNGGIAPIRLHAMGSPHRQSQLPAISDRRSWTRSTRPRKGIDGDADLVDLCDVGAMECQTVEDGAVFKSGSQ